MFVFLVLIHSRGDDLVDNWQKTNKKRLARCETSKIRSKHIGNERFSMKEVKKYFLVVCELENAKFLAFEILEGNFECFWGANFDHRGLLSSQFEVSKGYAFKV